MKITNGPKLPIPLAGHCAVNIDDENVYFFGGIVMTVPGKGTISHNVFQYRHSEDSWTLVMLYSLHILQLKKDFKLKLMCTILSICFRHF